MNSRKVDKIFLFTATLLVMAGIFVFASASLGIFARDEAKFYGIVVNQLLLGLTCGVIAFLIFSKTPYLILKKFALPIFVFSLILTALVFIPGVGLEHGGATRWINIFSFSFQPSEFLKLGLVVCLAAIFSRNREGSRSFLSGVLPFAALMAIVAVVMLKQPDTGTLIVMSSAAAVIYFAAGAKWKHILFLVLIGALGISALVSARPYLKDRIVTFLNPNTDPWGSSYQIKQSLIAIGSGEIFGRGLGQSVQKFNYLPEPVGDSVFAVIGEEFGFFGGALTVILFLALGLRGLKIASNARDEFGSYLAVGLTTLIISQSFINMASLIGIFPLTGVPLVFISHGGTALLFALAEIGIVANISSYGKRLDTRG